MPGLHNYKCPFTRFKAHKSNNQLKRTLNVDKHKHKHRQKDMSSATEMIDISIDTEMIDASIPSHSYDYEDFLTCAPKCATSTNQQCISDGTKSTDDMSIDDPLSSSSSSTPITSERFTNILNVYDVSSNILGTGNYGTVRECSHRVSGTKYAVKSINKSKVSRLDHVKREVQLLKAVDHPNIMKMIDSFEDEDYVHIVTEICTGVELFDLVVDNTTDYGCLPEDQAMSIIKALLESVQYLHSKDIVHRDIKPENLVLSSSGQVGIVKIIDFGLSRRHGVNEGNMTNQVGTPYYMSPDILRGNYDRTCDLWAVGVVCYILLTGYPPYNGNNDSEVHASTKKGHLVFERQVWGNLSKSSRDFVRKLLCTDATRIRTADDALRHPWLSSR